MSFDINKWFNNGEPEDTEGHDEEEPWRGIPPETFMELVESLVVQPDVCTNVGLPSIVMILWMTAQESSYELIHDITEEVRFKLGDWPDDEKAKLHQIEIRQLFFGCEMRLEDPETHKDHSIPIAQILRIGTTAETKETGWHWSQVVSDYDFELVVQGICDEYHQQVTGHEHQSSVVIGSRVVQSTVREQFAEQLRKPKIEREISEFRAELDALFPSTPPPEGGKSDANS